ncbi:FtsX-like permease family protein [Promicromonospora iranensis]|uniref:ABC transport system permease protein n=1 Tax=Promicromonospora iranensis TaxID=1105144 RepID=A0ABU2CW14_9MICO|nr:FtsX-like permease family protein [Promicromonospora iranensis]MDR7385510.1 putative ABC transport system permease protein [Promicromonospora iranensis]
MIAAHSLKTFRDSWRAYAGAVVALAGGTGLIGVAVNLLGSLGTTSGQAGVPAQVRAQLDDLGSLFGFVASISLFMALFVVSSTFAFVVATRRRELGLLRLIGATPRQVRQLLLGEAAVVAVLGSTFGMVLATAVTPLMFGVLDLTGMTPVPLTAPAPGTAWAIAAPLGAGVALTGAWRAGGRAGRTQPAEAFRAAVLERRRPGVLQALGAVAALAALVSAVALAPRMDLLFALLAGMLLPIVAVVGINGVGGLVYPALAGLVGRVADRDPAARLARDHARASVRMTTAVAAPVVAISALAGSLLLTMSFGTDGTEGADRAALTAPLVAEVAGDTHSIATAPGVATADVRRTVEARLGRGTVEAEVVDVAASASTRSLRAVRGSLDGLRGAGVAVTESYVSDLGGRVGDVRTLQVGDVRTKVTITAIVPDAPNLWADVLVPHDLPGVAAAARPVGTVFVVPGDVTGDGEDVAAVAATLREAGADVATAEEWIRRKADVAREMNDFVLLVMLGPAGVYAAIAAVNAVLIGSSQRRHQLRTARLLGATPAQVRRAAVWETCFTGAAALLVGGAVTGFVGWFIRQAVMRDVPAAPLTIPWLPLAGMVAACVLVVLAAGVAGARAATRE